MKLFLILPVFVTIICNLNGQPCKSVKPGMTKAEVLLSVGPPTEIDTIPHFDGDNGELRVVWQYGDVMKDGNQRVQFVENIVETEVIADGKRFEELMAAFG